MTCAEIGQRGLEVHQCRGCEVAIVLLRPLTARERDALEEWWGSPGYRTTGHSDAWCPHCWYDCFAQGDPPVPPPHSAYVEEPVADA